MTATTDSPPISFADDIRPLFRDEDRTAMLSRFDLWDHEDVSHNAAAILHAVKAGTMPCDGAWPRTHVDVLSHWIDAGCPA